GFGFTKSLFEGQDRRRRRAEPFEPSPSSHGLAFGERATHELARAHLAAFGRLELDRRRLAGARGVDERARRDARHGEAMDPKNETLAQRIGLGKRGGGV